MSVLRRCTKNALCRYVKYSIQDSKPIGFKTFSFLNVPKTYGYSCGFDVDNKEIIIDQSFSNLHKLRQYVSMTSKFERNCWNCEKAVTFNKHHIKCENCGHVQDINANVNFFELMNIPEGFNVDVPILTKRFHQLQAVVHPDKFFTRSTREQENSAAWSALINRAYKTILDPLERAQYLLKLKGLAISMENSTLNEEFLVRMMERNEDVDGATTIDDLNQQMTKLKNDLEIKTQYLNNAFKNDEIKQATKLIVEMKYLLSIENRIKNKLLSLLNVNT